MLHYLMHDMTSYHALNTDLLHDYRYIIRLEIVLKNYVIHIIE